MKILNHNKISKKRKLKKFFFRKKEIIKEMKTVMDVLRWTVSKFNSSEIYCGHNTNNVWDEAKQLVLSSLFLPINILTEIKYTRLSYSERSFIFKRVKQRINDRIPVSYIINKAWFCSLEFYVDNRVVIPRSPIGELILNKFYNLLPYSPKRILDMCTGSGCIAISCSYFYPNSEIDAVDISHDALTIAEYNIQVHNSENKITPIHSNLFCKLEKLTYDLIIANPPYVEKGEIKNLPKEFSFEPIVGLEAGTDGLKIVEEILFQVSDYLNDNGVFICEVGNSMINLVEKYPEIKFNWIKFLNKNKYNYGIFFFTKKELIKYKNFLKASKN